MNSELFACQFCKEYFSIQREPFLLPDCGHSVCAECLTAKLKNGNQFVCKEDGVQVTRNQMNEFPKNFALLQIIKNRPTNRKIVMNNSPKQLENEQDSDRCKKHGEKMDVVCVDHRVRICAKCALFGDHADHKVVNLEDALKKIIRRIDELKDMSERLDVTTNETFEMSQYFNKIELHFQSNLDIQIKQVNQFFDELSQILDNKRNKIIAECKDKIIHSQELYNKYIKEAFIDVQRKVELWRMTSKDRIHYYEEQQKANSIPFELISISSTNELMLIGAQYLKELESTKQQILLKIDEPSYREIHLELKSDLEQFINTYLIVYQKDPQFKLENSLSRLESITECSLLKDINSSIIQDPLNQNQMEQWIKQYQENQQQKQLNQQYIFQQQQQQQQQQQFLYAQQQLQQQQQPQNQPFQQQLSYSNHQRTDQPLTSQELDDQYLNNLKKSPSATTLATRRTVSPSPIRRSMKQKKINEKFQPLIVKLKGDNLDQCDFSQAELGDEGLLSLITIIKKTKNLRVLKLAKNKIQDAAAQQLLTELIEKQNENDQENNQIQTINLSSNMLTDKLIDTILDLCKKYSKTMQHQSLNQIYLNQNIINLSRVKRKVDEIKKYGLIIAI
ncbi:unnamed protein product (macronuclear) [Paramecium tetraurelia]|uniref:B box-type domain-containing protein n=1 Tax=Paramecium tetraurelia TaxID=5888 RepID=A0CF23_PARTE|nr:uncharacterized protein GSPATT00037829001 [Paramecium tetraurelia]CAK69390.1 unnamed protein product [Paramecium tetraurelia]|eukprot:XP_001436787.1 hypothetical protein (macronuclear) [Paramecium tetraurelia strain d4-2]